MIEAMACANAMLLYKKRVSNSCVNGDESPQVTPMPSPSASETTSLLSGPIGKFSEIILFILWDWVVSYSCLSGN